MFIGSLNSSQKAEKLISMMWWSYQKILPSIRNIILNWCAVCVKQYEEKMPRFVAKLFRTCSHHFTCWWFFGQNENQNHFSANVFTGFVPLWLFMFQNLKRLMKGRIFVTIDEIKEKPHLKKRISKCSMYILSLFNWITFEDFFKRDKIDINEKKPIRWRRFKISKRLSM